MSNDTTVQFLWNIENISSLKENQVNLEPVRFELRNTRAALEKEFSLPKSLTGPKTRCQNCHKFWSEGQFTMKIDPARRLKSSSRRLIKKNVQHMNDFQKKFIEKLRQSSKNTMVIKCLLCHSVSKRKLEKPEKVSEVTLNSSTMEDVPTSSKSKKKRKNRDSFAGLNVSAIQSVYEQSTPLAVNPKIVRKLSNMSNTSLNKSFPTKTSEGISRNQSTPLSTGSSSKPCTQPISKSKLKKKKHRAAKAQSSILRQFLKSI